MELSEVDLDHFKVTGWAFVVPFGVLLPVYGFAFYKAIRGTRYKVVLLILTFLTISIVCFILFGVASFMEHKALEKIDLKNPFTLSEFNDFTKWAKF